MKILYKNKTLEKVCQDYSAARKKYNSNMAEKIHQRVDQIKEAQSVEVLVNNRIGRCHKLSADRKGQYAMVLEQPYRLVFTVQEDEIQIAKIEEIVDYHK